MDRNPFLFIFPYFRALSLFPSSLLDGASHFQLTGRGFPWAGRIIPTRNFNNLMVNRLCLPTHPFFSSSSFGVLFYFPFSIFHSIFERLLDFTSVIWCSPRRLLILFILPDNLKWNSSVLEILHLCFVSEASQRQSTVPCGEQEQCQKY